MRERTSQPELPMPDVAMANAYRVAADTARVNPGFTRKEREARAAHYERMARECEVMA